MVKQRGLVIREEIERQINYSGKIDAQQIAAKFGISTQAIYKHVKLLIENAIISREKNGKQFKYELLPIESIVKSYSIDSLKGDNGMTKEDIVIAQDFKAHITPYLSNQAFRNYYYVFTEILNNAIDHSEGTEVKITCEINDFSIKTDIEDKGVGIFQKIQNSLGLSDKKHAFLELAKGKFTTDAQRHTSQGIFFSSKISDGFFIESDDILFAAQEGDDDRQYLSDFKSIGNGTTVSFHIERNTAIIDSDVFQKYSVNPDADSFDKTIIPVYLLEYEESNPLYVSRSQAKRLLMRIETFRSVLLDFENVPDIGQGFADEIFRVFANAHPECKIVPYNTTKAVEAMIRRVKN